MIHVLKLEYMLNTTIKRMYQNKHVTCYHCFNVPVRLLTFRINNIFRRLWCKLSYLYGYDKQWQVLVCFVLSFEWYHQNFLTLHICLSFFIWYNDGTILKLPLSPKSCIEHQHFCVLWLLQLLPQRNNRTWRKLWNDGKSRGY